MLRNPFSWAGKELKGRKLKVPLIRFDPHRTCLEISIISNTPILKFETEPIDLALRTRFSHAEDVVFD